MKTAEFLELASKINQLNHLNTKEIQLHADFIAVY